MTHTHLMTNLDAADWPLYQGAIYLSGLDLRIRPGRYSPSRECWDEHGFSLWCSLLEGDLTEFWDLVEAGQ